MYLQRRKMNNYHLGTVEDKTGEQVEIFHCKDLIMSPIYTKFLRSIADLIDTGFRYFGKTWEDEDCGVLYAKINNVTVGHLVYSRSQAGVLWVIEGSVEEEFRRRRIYTILYEFLETIAKENKAAAILSLVHVDNVARVESAKAYGMVPVYYQMIKEL